MSTKKGKMVSIPRGGRLFTTGKKRRFRRSRYSMALQPSTVVKKMRYVDYANVVVSPGTVGQYRIRANSIYDPNATGLGHQPNGHDLYSTLYNHYVVLGSKCTAYIWGETSSPTVACVGGIVLSDDGVINTANITNLMEQEHTKFKMFRYNADGSPSITKLVKRFSAKKFFDCKDIKDGKEQYGANFSNNPTEAAEFNIWFAHPSNNVETTYNIMFVVEYIV